MAKRHKHHRSVPRILREARLGVLGVAAFCLGTMLMSVRRLQPVTDLAAVVSAGRCHREDDDLGLVSNPGSLNATVMAMALEQKYEREDYERFVGSLRKSGFAGAIVIAVDASLAKSDDDAGSGVLRYLEFRNATAVPVEITDECKTASDDLPRWIQKHPCLKSQPQLKVGWARYSIFRDWLIGCEACTGPVLHADFDDTYFQADPFGPFASSSHANRKNGESLLHLYQTDYNIKNNSEMDQSIAKCTGTDLSYHTGAGDGVGEELLGTEVPLLNAGCTMAGSREAMLHYLDTMASKINEWAADPHCSFEDEAVHNYLFYSGQLGPGAVAVQNRAPGGAFNSVDKLAREVLDEHIRTVMEKYNVSEKKGAAVIFPAACVLPTNMIYDSHSPSPLLNIIVFIKQPRNINLRVEVGTAGSGTILKILSMMGDTFCSVMEPDHLWFADSTRSPNGGAHSWRSGCSPTGSGGIVCTTAFTGAR